ncbi:MAG: molybdopterin-dependent oxidoreductase [Candidatus Mariimomonas ferrooxydans]
MKFSDSADMDETDLFILVDLDPSQWERVHPALDASIRKRIARGAKLVVINKNETKISSVAAVNIKDDEVSALKKIAKAFIAKGNKAGKEMESAISGVSTAEDTDKVAELLTGAKAPVIFSSPALFNASKNISLLVETKVIAVPLEANARGVIVMGLSSEGRSYKEMLSGGVAVLYAIGEVPVAERPKVNFLVVQTSYLTDLAKQADLVLPSASYLESKGTIINYLGKIKDLSMAVGPAGIAKQHKDIFIALSKIMGKPIKDSESDGEAEIKAKAKTKFSPFEKKQGLDIDPAEFVDSLNLCVINSSRLLWLKETEKAVGV